VRAIVSVCVFVLGMPFVLLAGAVGHAGDAMDIVVRIANTVRPRRFE
jgi:hypothetical protein